MRERGCQCCVGVGAGNEGTCSVATIGLCIPRVLLNVNADYFNSIYELATS